MQAIGVIGAPSSAGAYAPGQELAPQRLREANLLDKLEQLGVGAHDRGDLASRRWSPDRSSRRAQNVGEVIAMVEDVRSAAEACIEAGERPLVLGGDCTVGLGTIAALDTPGLVYVDLHADMNVPASTSDGALDWMGLGHALGLDGSVPDLAARCELRADQVVLLGFDATQATAWEREQVLAQAVSVVDVAALAADPSGAAHAALATVPAEHEAIAVHFDVDIVDFIDAPLSENTGRNVGVPLQAALDALATLLGDPRATALTVTELNPLHGEADGSTLTRFVDGLARACAHWRLT
jgi:arginase